MYNHYKSEVVQEILKAKKTQSQNITIKRKNSWKIVNAKQDKGKECLDKLIADYDTKNTVAIQTTKNFNQFLHSPTIFPTLFLTLKMIGYIND